MNKSGSARRVQEEEEEPDGKEGKNQGGKRKSGATQEQPVAKKQKCPDFNSPGGCTKKERNCPHKLSHRCSKCGNWNHGAHMCKSKR